MNRTRRAVLSSRKENLKFGKKGHIRIEGKEDNIRFVIEDERVSEGCHETIATLIYAFNDRIGKLLKINNL